MNIIISNTSDKPIYQQLFDQISSQIIKGELEGDYNLPPIRTAAKELRVSIITVKKAWEELERAGFIYTIVGKGCFVVPSSKDELSDKKMQLAQAKLEKDIKYYKELGLSLEDIISLMQSNY